MKLLITLIVACALLWDAYEAGHRIGRKEGYANGFFDGVAEGGRGQTGTLTLKFSEPVTLREDAK